MNKLIFIAGMSALLVLAFLLGACSSGPKPTVENPIQGKPIASGPIGNLKVTLSNDTGRLKSGDQEIMIAFTDASGKPVDAGTVNAASVNLHMPAMGSMAAMNDAVTLSTTSVPGVYRGKVKIEMPGEWQAQISYEGSAGTGKTSIPVTAN
jgi:hypothetical protein